MGFLDRLLGRGQGRQQGFDQGYGHQNYPRQDYVRQDSRAGRSADDQAIRRYQYLLQTAPPEQIEKAHEEAFAKLAPDQRRELLHRLAQGDPADRPVDDSPRALARSATRSEMRQPGTLGRMFGQGGMGMRGGMGGMGLGMGGMLLTSVAGAFVGTAIASELFDQDGFMDWDTSNPEDAGGEAAESGVGDGEQAFADGGGAEAGSYDAGGFDGGGFDGGGFDGGGFDGGGFDGGSF